MPWAQLGDLGQFLVGGRQVDEHYEAYDFDRRFSRIGRESDNLPGHLIQQCLGVADAVDWLHNKVKLLETQEVYPCIHMDLKPDNILIESDSRSMVGRWKISDFGLSVVQEDSNVVTVRDFVSRMSRTTEKRYEGTFTAPEVKLGQMQDQKIVSRRSDIWSLAAIFAVVLAFAVNRENEVEWFRQKRLGKIPNSDRSLHNDDGFYTLSYSQNQLGQGVTSANFALRQQVAEYLNEVPSRKPSEQSWIRCWSDAISELLVVKREDRPESDRVLRLFTRVDQHFRNHQSTYRCQCQVEPHLRRPSEPHPIFTPPLALPSMALPVPVQVVSNTLSVQPSTASPTITQTTGTTGTSTDDIHTDRQFSDAPSILPVKRHGILINPQPHLNSLGSYSKSRPLEMTAAGIALATVSDGIVAAYLKNNRVIMKRILTKTEEIRDNDPPFIEFTGTYLDGWQNIRLSGNYLACWGHTRKDGGHYQIDIRHIKEGSKAIAYNTSTMKTVAVSPTGLFALVFSNRVIIETLS
jgi:serine/threonine protein kinase